MGKYKAIEQCKDSNILIESFTDSILEYFEEQLQEYLKSSGNRKSYPLIVQWWEGLIDTEDFIEMCGQMVKSGNC